MVTLFSIISFNHCCLNGGDCPGLLTRKTRQPAALAINQKHTRNSEADRQTQMLRQNGCTDRYNRDRTWLGNNCTVSFTFYTVVHDQSAQQ